MYDYPLRDIVSGNTFKLVNMEVGIPDGWERWKYGPEKLYLRELRKNAFFVVYNVKEIELNTLKCTYKSLCGEIEDGNIIEYEEDESLEGLYINYIDLEKKGYELCRIVLAWKEGHLFKFKFYGQKRFYPRIIDNVLSMIYRYKPWEDYPWDTYDPHFLDSVKFEQQFEEQEKVKKEEKKKRQVLLRKIIVWSVCGIIITGLLIYILHYFLQ